MNKQSNRPDYSIKKSLIKRINDKNNPRINNITLLKVKPTAVRCSKGDCDQDYCPG